MVKGQEMLISEYMQLEVEEKMSLLCIFTI